MTIRAGTVRTSRDAEIYYELQGSGPPMALIAGLGDDLTSWEPQIGFFRKHYAVLAIDNRGIGRSSIPEGPYSIRQMADDAHLVVSEIGLDPVIAIGSSMGGAICQEWAINYPDDIDQLVLTNTWAERDAFTDALFDHWIGLGDIGAGSCIMESLLLFCFCPAYINANPDFVKEFLSLDPPPLDGFVASAHACRWHHTIDRLSRVHQRTLVVAGELDILTRPEFSRRLANTLQNGEYTGLPTGHMPFWEMPDEFNRKVAGFLEQAT